MSLRFHRAAWVFGFASLLSLVRPARADEASDKAQGTALFDEGRKLMAQKNYEEACKRFSDAQKLIPGAGVSLNLADCFEKQGKTASAWNEFKHAQSLAHEKGQSDKEALARVRADTLGPRLSRLTIIVAPNVASIPNIALMRDGETVPESQWGADVPVDPRTIVVEALASGKVVFTQSVDVKPSDSRVTITIAAVGDASVAPPTPVDAPPTPVAPPQPTPPPQPALPPPQPAPAAPQPAPYVPPPYDATAQTQLLQPHNAEPLVTSHPAPVQKIFGYILGGAGLAAGGVGAAFAALATINTNTTKDDTHCGTNNHCDAFGYDLRQTAIQQGWIATGLFIAGGSALGIGIILVATAPTPPEDQLHGLPGTTSRLLRQPGDPGPFRLELHVGPAGATLGGTF